MEHEHPQQALQRLGVENGDEICRLYWKDGRLAVAISKKAREVEPELWGAYLADLTRLMALFYERASGVPLNRFLTIANRLFGKEMREPRGYPQSFWGNRKDQQ